MMRLICNGRALDLMSGASLSFKKENPIFAFDSISCERTQSFDLPATPTNDYVFGISKNPATYGEGMRRRFSCELQDGQVVKNGYLYVTSYDAKKMTYKAVFVTGELIGLKRIKEAGKLSEIVTTNSYVKYGGPTVPPSMGGGMLYANVRYKKEVAGIIEPSMNLQQVAQMATQAIGAQVEWPDGISRVRVIPAKSSALKGGVVSFDSVSNGQIPSPEPTEPFNTISSVVGVFDAVLTPVHCTMVNQQTTSLVNQFVARQSVSLTFPYNWDEHLYICELSADTMTPVRFYGERSFAYTTYNQPATITGEPLAGRTIEIESGSAFMIVDVRDYVYTRIQVLGSWVIDAGFQFGETQLDFSHDLQTEGKDLQSGDNVRLQDNLPDMTLVEVLKVFAAITGTALNYTEERGVFFDPLTSGWEREEKYNQTGVLSIDTVSRGFGDYARRNYVRFKDSDAVPSANRLTVVYEVDSDNIEREKDLQVIPFSEGAEVLSSGFPILEVGYLNESDVIANAINGNYMQRVGLVKNQRIQTLCDESTLISVNIKMSLHDFERIKPKTIVLIRNTLYAWTDANYKNGVCSANLVKYA